MGRLAKVEQRDSQTRVVFHINTTDRNFISTSFNRKEASKAVVPDLFANWTLSDHSKSFQTHGGTHMYSGKFFSNTIFCKSVPYYLTLKSPRTPRWELLF